MSIERYPHFQAGRIADIPIMYQSHKHYPPPTVAHPDWGKVLIEELDSLKWSAYGDLLQIETTARQIVRNWLQGLAYRRAILTEEVRFTVKVRSSSLDIEWDDESFRQAFGIHSDFYFKKDESKKLIEELQQAKQTIDRLQTDLANRRFLDPLLTLREKTEKFSIQVNPR